MTVSQGERIVLLTLGVITFGLVLGVAVRGSTDFNGKISSSGYSMQVVEPGIVKVALRMNPLPGGVMEPALLLEAETGARCDRVSPLVVNSYFVKDVFYVDIGAYALKSSENKNCSNDFQLAEALVPVTSIFNTNGEGKRDAKIILRDSTNNYRLSKDEYAVYLEPLETVNVLLSTNGPKGGQRIVACLKKTSSLRAPQECRE
jgi:hypothetical protein